MKRQELTDRLAGQVFLSTMLDITDAAYVVAHSRGAGFAQLGTLLVAPDAAEYATYRERWPKSFLPNDESAMRDVLAREVAIVREGLGAATVVCLSIGGFEVEAQARAAEAFRQAGGDMVELNAHGRLQPFADQGYLAGLALPAYRGRLVGWAEALAQVDLPLLIKFNGQLDVDWAQLLADLAHVPVAGYHFNVRAPRVQAPNEALVRTLRPLVKGALLCSGYAWTAEAARRLFDLGVDAVGVAQPAREDPEFLPRLRASLAAP